MSASRRKGTAWERAVADYLAANGFPYAERAPLRGNGDRGDITGTPGIVWECKATKEITLAAFIDETERERKNADAELGIAVIKRRQRPVQDAYAVLRLEDLARLLRDLDNDCPTLAQGDDAA
jgi:hypothetical protein